MPKLILGTTSRCSCSINTETTNPILLVSTRILSESHSRPRKRKE